MQIFSWSEDKVRAVSKFAVYKIAEQNYRTYKCATQRKLNSITAVKSIKKIALRYKAIYKMETNLIEVLRW